MNKVCMVAFNFGLLPNYFPIWIKGVEKNQNYDFILYTDDETSKKYILKNLKIIIISFEDFCEKIKKNYSFDIFIDKPYKICDYRPAFGEILHDDLKYYEFWGTIDLDIILGKIDSFITNEILDKYDKILTRDHFCIYKNVDEVNQYYKRSFRGDSLHYKKVFSNNEILAFGERGPYGVYHLWLNEKERMYDEDIIVDILPNNYYFKYKNNGKIKNSDFILYDYNNGKLYSYYSGNKIEYMYSHFQKRKMIYLDENSEYYVAFPNCIKSCSIEDVSKFIVAMHRRCFIKTLLFKFKYTLKRIKRIIKKKLNLKVIK